MSNIKIFEKNYQSAPRQSLIQELETLLESARNGILRSLVAVSHFNTGEIGVHEAIDDYSPYYSILGGVTHLQNQMLCDPYFSGGTSEIPVTKK